MAVFEREILDSISLIDKNVILSRAFAFCGFGVG